MAIFALPGAEGLRNERVQANQYAAAKERDNIENAGADADGADGVGAVRLMTDHDGVDDAHGHPPDLGENKGQRQAQGGAHFGAKSLQAEHFFWRGFWKCKRPTRTKAKGKLSRDRR